MMLPASPASPAERVFVRHKNGLIALDAIREIADGGDEIIVWTDATVEHGEQPQIRLKMTLDSFLEAVPSFRVIDLERPDAE